MNKLEINKDNYKGYIELYKGKTEMSSDEIKCRQNTFNKLLVISIIPFIVIIIATLIKAPSIVGSFIIAGYGAADVILLCDYLKKEYDLNKKIMNEIKEKYQYVDINISLLELRKSLEKANIITYSNNQRYINEEKYAHYIKCEQIKEDYLRELKETKYIDYSDNTDIEYQELDFPKVKKIGVLNK